VTSPIDGRAGQALVRTGNLIKANDVVLTTVVSMDPVYVYFVGDENVYLKYGALARLGQRPSSRDVQNPIRMGLSNEEGYPHIGHMDFVDNQVDPNTGTIRGSRGVRQQGPAVHARTLRAAPASSAAAPIRQRSCPIQAGTATIRTASSRFVLGPENKIEYRAITLGPMIDGLRVVKDGLKGGDKIVVNGLQRVRPGMPVTPTEVEPEDRCRGAPSAP
jgi:multidrug efflux system membrane fusion protein